MLANGSSSTRASGLRCNLRCPGSHADRAPLLQAQVFEDGIIRHYKDGEKGDEAPD